jgi:hypothetical protein
MVRFIGIRLLPLVFVAAALYPVVARQEQLSRIRRRLDGLLPAGAIQSSQSSESGKSELNDAPPGACSPLPDPALLVRVAEWGPWLAGWQTVAGCGAGSATGGGAGVKWIGRGATGGLFNVQCQASYTRIRSVGKQEHHTFVNTLVSREISEKWLFGANVPFVYKYLENYYIADAFNPGAATDVSNGGLGDVSLQVSRRLGPINATTLTALMGLPTGTYSATYRMSPLHQHQQLGFGKLTGSLLLDHTMDEIWGVIVVGGLAGWRGGENSLNNYRAPSATGYAYTGYYLGRFVPAAGLALTAFKGHDRDQTIEENSGLFSAAANVSVEWSTDYLALLLGASLPYQYDGIRKDANGAPRSPWGWGSWMVAFGLAMSPF